MKLKNLFLTTVIALFAIACSNDDEPQIPKSEGEHKMENLDVTAYDKWTYINLETGEKKTLDDTSEWIYTDGTTRPAQPDVNVNMDWHIAIHRYEIKTNSGEAYDTGEQDFASVTSLPKDVSWAKDKVVTLESQNSVDEPLEVTTDMKHMMDGNVGYSKEPSLNTVLCGWTSRTPQQSMPPVKYTPTRHVLLVKFANGSWGKLQFTAAGNTETNKSGYVTFNYEFFSVK